MAVTKIADIYNPVTFAGRAQRAQIELNKFINSGIVVVDPSLKDQISAGGNTGTLTNYKPLETDEPNYSNDDDTAKAVPAKTSSEEMTFRLAMQNKSWSVMDLAKDLALQDPVTSITDRIGAYWATNNEKRVIKSALGVLADNIANDSSTMLKTVATDGAGAVTDAERISADNILDAAQTMGDHSGKLTTIAMHSALYTRLKKQNLIDFIPNARGEVVIPTYLGYVVVFDDSMPAVAGSNRITYTCILFGAGAFVSAEGRVEKSSEMDRDASAGKGGGQTILYSRRSDLIHPVGFSFLSGSVAGKSATQAELALAANWDRVWDRKQVPMAFLQVND